MINQINLSERDFRCFDLRGLNLEYANLNGKLFGGAILENARLRGVDLSAANLVGTKMYGIDLTEAMLDGAVLTNADLFDAKLKGASLVGTQLQKASLCRADITQASLINANLSGTNLVSAVLTNADLTGADLSGSDLTCADLTDAILQGTIGIGTKQKEIRFAKYLLGKLKAGQGQLEMRRWHTCHTTHCIAGWAFPNISYPGAKASREYPTLARYFEATNEEALDVLELVASGRLSVFPD